MKQKNSQKLDCIKKITDLLSEDKLLDAFSILRDYLNEMEFLIEEDEEVLPQYTTSSAYYKRASKAFRIGTLSWEQFNLDNSLIIERTILLAKSVCNHYHQGWKTGNTRSHDFSPTPFDQERMEIKKSLQELFSEISKNPRV